jgi:hypothetical protein
VNGEWLFDDVAKETFRKQLWPAAAGAEHHDGAAAPQERISS